MKTDTKIKKHYELVRNYNQKRILDVIEEWFTLRKVMTKDDYLLIIQLIKTSE